MEGDPKRVRGHHLWLGGGKRERGLFRDGKDNLGKGGWKGKEIDRQQVDGGDLGH